jgi:DNA processing protein
MARLKHWVWLSRVDGVRPLVKYNLIQAMGGVENIFYADQAALQAQAGVTESEARHLADKSMAPVEKILSRCQEDNIQIITIQDAQYPERLRNIPDPPVVLYVWGTMPEVDDLAVIAVVGTRKASPYGIKMAMKMGKELAQGGAVVVSGLALGCDGAAMEAAMRADGQVLGVLGTAIDQVYPRQNRPLFEAARHQGALISEYPPGMRTYPSSFTARNRIITGLSLGVVVVEAPIKSGTANTAHHALEQGRDVFAVPGNLDAACSAGCNRLIQEGAIVATSGEAVLAQYESYFALKQEKNFPTHIKKEIDNKPHIVYIDLTAAEEKLPSAQRRVLQAMTRPDMHADEIIEATGMDAKELMAALTALQITGYITQTVGKRYTRKL